MRVESQELKSKFKLIYYYIIENFPVDLNFWNWMGNLSGLVKFDSMEKFFVL